VDEIIISTAGMQGPRGNTWWPTDGPPADSLGVDGDYALDQADPDAPAYYGPKTNGTWTGTGPYTLGGSTAGLLQADNNLSDVDSPPAARTNLGLGSAATEAASAFDEAGAAAAAQAAAEASAAASFQPLQPSIFLVSTYGARGDGRCVSDGAMAAGSAVLTSSSAQFGNVVAGMPVMVVGAAPTGVTTLVTTAVSVQGNGQITLAATNTSGANLTGALVFWGTDDTAAIQRTINAALAYAAAHGSATVFFPGGGGLYYVIAGALVTGSPTLGNSQLTLGAPVATTGNKISLTLEAPGNGSALEHWQQTVPQLNGTTLVSFGVFASSPAQSTSISTYGNPCVIGGPAQPAGFGVSPGVFSNMLLTVRNLSVLTTHSLYGLTYSALDLSGIAEANLENFAYGTTATVPSGAYEAPAQFANGLSIGVLMPANGNNDNNRCSNVSCHGGFTFAFFATEHTVCDRLTLLYCWSALCPVGLYYGSVGSTHAIHVQQASIEGCTNVVNFIGVGSGGIGPWLYATIDTETSSPTFTDRTSGTGLAAALGTVTLTGLFTPADVTVTAPTGLKIINGQAAYPVTSVSANYSVTVLDNTVLVNAAASAVTVTLISALYTPNSYTIKKTDGSGNAVTVATIDGQTIDGASTATLTTPNAAITVLPQGGVWHVA
jgi:hypothetical protein